MIKISRKMEYALMALKFLASKKSGELTTAREIGEAFNAPFDTVAKVMQAMNSKKLLNSAQGMKGGYSLACNLEKISYTDLVQIIDGAHPLVECDCHRSCKIKDRCNIKLPIKVLTGKMLHFLGDITLSELLLEPRH